MPNLNAFSQPGLGVLLVTLTHTMSMRVSDFDATSRFWGDATGLEVVPLDESRRSVDDPTLIKIELMSGSQPAPQESVNEDAEDSSPIDTDDEDDDDAGYDSSEKWTADETKQDWLDDGAAEPNWDLKIAKDFLDPANYKPKVEQAPCPMLNATTPMPRGTGLGGCDPGFTPAQCALHTLGLDALPLDEECLKVATLWSADLEELNSAGYADEMHCQELNKRYNLGNHHKCCSGSWSQGCAFTPVRGEGALENVICRQYKPPLQGASEECHYALAYYSDFEGLESVHATDNLHGTETAQNEEYTDYEQCTKWENMHHLTTILDSRAIGFRPPFPHKWRPRYEGVEDPTPAIRADEAKIKSGLKNENVAPPVPEVPGTQQTPGAKLEAREISEESISLGESANDFFDVSNSDNGGTGLEEHGDLGMLTTISVITAAKKEVICSHCLMNETEYVETVKEYEQEQANQYKEYQEDLKKQKADAALAKQKKAMKKKMKALYANSTNNTNNTNRTQHEDPDDADSDSDDDANSSSDHYRNSTNSSNSSSTDDDDSYVSYTDAYPEDLLMKARMSGQIHPVSEGICEPHVSRVCRHKTLLKCENLCFLIGYRGRLSKGETPWKQAFTEKHCPVGSVVQRHTIASRVSSRGTGSIAARMGEIEVTENATLDTTINQTALSPVTLTNLTDSVKHLPRAFRSKVLAETYETEDEDAMLCCFPGCALPLRLEDGTDNPWYWYDSEKTMQEAASMEAVHIF